ncbi:MAG: hypothetical protein Q8O67_09055 [Deltaproteobacteria bacterium]|nr:hypothetical protein [Deltaproteobacteria bacterium]
MRPIVVAALLAQGVAFAVAAGCSDEARQTRRDDAFDVSGTWSGAAGVLTIDNETDKNDVVVRLERPSSSALEQPFLDRVAPPLDKTIALDLELGAGVDGVRTEIDGGENVSFDGGVTSTISVSGVDFAAVPTAGATDASLRWSGLLVADDDDGLVGSLRLSAIERRPRASDIDGFTTESEHVDVDVAFSR